VASIHKRGGKYWVRWVEGGRGGQSRSVTCATKREADAYKADIEAALLRDGTFQSGRIRAETGLDAMIAAYLEHSSRVHAPRTTIRYGQHLVALTRFLRRGSRRRQLRAQELSYDMLSAFHTWLMEPETGRHLHRRGPETARKIVTCIEGFWDWAFRRQQRGAWAGVPYPDSLDLKRAPPAEKSPPTWPEMDAAIAACNGWHRQVAVLLRCTGLRISQVMGLRWEDLDLEGGVLHLRPELGKSAQEKRGRRIPIAPVLVEELAGWGVRDGHVVDAPAGTNAGDRREYRARDMGRAWKRAGVRLEAWKGTPCHAFRAGFESGLKREGADDEAVEYLVGHSRGIREHYVGPQSLPMRAAVALVPHIGGPAKVVELTTARTS